MRYQAGLHTRSTAVDGQYAPPLKCHPTNGATQVHITTEQDHGTWTFDYSTDTWPCPRRGLVRGELRRVLPRPGRPGGHPPTCHADDDDHRRRGACATSPRSRLRSRATDYSGAAISKSYVTRLEDGASFTVELFKRELYWKPGPRSRAQTHILSRTFTVSGSDLKYTIWDSGACPYVVFEQDILVAVLPHDVGLKCGYSKAQMTITPHRTVSQEHQTTDASASGS